MAYSCYLFVVVVVLVLVVVVVYPCQWITLSTLWTTGAWGWILRSTRTRVPDAEIKTLIDLLLSHRAIIDLGLTLLGTKPPYVIQSMQPSQYFQIRTYHVYRLLWFLADEEIHWSFSLHHGLRLTMPLRFVMAKRVATQLGRRSVGLSDAASLPGPTPWCLRCWWSFEVLYVFLQLINTS